LVSVGSPVGLFYRGWYWCSFGDWGNLLSLDVLSANTP
jgi:hypothetical protein